MKRGIIISSVFALVLFCGSSTAQTVTAGTGGTFSNLSAAIQSFETGGSNESNPAPNVINCLDASYDELFPTINVQLTINGKAGRSTLLGQVNAGNDGFSLDPPAGATIELNDLILLPSATGTPTDDLIDIIGAATGIVTFNRCVVSSNFSGVPLSLDGMTAPTGTPTAQVGDNGVNISNAASAATIDFNDTIITLASGPNTATTPDNILMTGAGKNTMNINAGCVISYGQLRNIQANNVDDLNIIGTKAKPVYLLGPDGSHIGLFTTSGGGVVTIDHCIMANGLASTAHADSAASIDIENPTRPTTITNTLIINNNGPAIRFLFDPANFPDPATYTPQLSLQNVTIAHNANGSSLTADVAQVLSDALAAGANVSFQNTIIAGGKTGIDLAGGTISLSNSALVLSGPDALTAATAGAGTVTQTAVINDDPQFHEIANLSSADLYDVFSNAYAGAGSAGSNLAGGADFIGTVVTPTPLPPTGATTWSLYR